MAGECCCCFLLTPTKWPALNPCVTQISIHSKRLTAQSALRHPWLINSALSTELHMTKVKLKRYVIRKRWIKAVNTIIALKRMGAKLDVQLV